MTAHPDFAQDARGYWFLDIVIEMPDVPALAIRSGVGTDLGLKDFAALSTGEKLAKPQRARKHKRHVAKLHAKVANARADKETHRDDPARSIR